MAPYCSQCSSESYSDADVESFSDTDPESSPFNVILDSTDQDYIALDEGEETQSVSDLGSDGETSSSELQQLQSSVQPMTNSTVTHPGQQATTAACEYLLMLSAAVFEDTVQWAVTQKQTTFNHQLRIQGR
jgi:hypothetical protein